MPPIPRVTYARTFDLSFYDGTNADDLLALIQESYPSASAMGGTPGVTTIIRTDIPDNGGYTFTFRIGDAWEKDQGIGYYQYESVAQTGYALPLAEFVQNVLAAELPGILPGLLPVPEAALGFKALTGTLGPGASATVSGIPISPHVPSASGYSAVGWATGAISILGDLEVLSAELTSGSAASAVVRNTGLISTMALTGATVVVHCKKD